ncbi:GmrSD restriction endonuclease domain-containing protein [Mycoplasma sp. 394]
MENNTKYELKQRTIKDIIYELSQDKLIIPEMQRPYVWKDKQVSDLFDSLYHGFPIGYIITNRPRNNDIKRKSYVSNDDFETVLIDGQQRLTALNAIINGLEVLDENYKKRRIIVSFNPFPKKNEEIFKIQNAYTKNSKKWISDISDIFKGHSHYKVCQKYINDNPEITMEDIDSKIDNLKHKIWSTNIGVIEIKEYVDLETLTEIFIRINSKGTPLKLLDYSISKISANKNYGTNIIRVMNYFSEILKTDNNIYREIEKIDPDFFKTEMGQKITWLSNINNNDYIYKPSVNDILFVSFSHIFDRAKMSDLVELLSGRDFEKREYIPENIQSNFEKIINGISSFIDKYNFNTFTQAIKNIGFKNIKINKNSVVINIAYIVFLKLRKLSRLGMEEVKKYTVKWYIMSLLTKRYKDSYVDQVINDLRNIKELGIEVILRKIDQTELTTDFWELRLPELLDTSIQENPFLKCYYAASVANGNKGFLTPWLTQEDMLKNLISDKHHIFPKQYLINSSNEFNEYSFLSEKKWYNHSANLVYLEKNINIKIKDKAPNVYFKEIIQDIKTNNSLFLGRKISLEELDENLDENCIPKDIINWTYKDYKDKFLPERRKLMAKKIKKWYENI